MAQCARPSARRRARRSAPCVLVLQNAVSVAAVAARVPRVRPSLPRSLPRSTCVRPAPAPSPSRIYNAAVHRPPPTITLTRGRGNQSDRKCRLGSCSRRSASCPVLADHSKPLRKEEPCQRADCSTASGCPAQHSPLSLAQGHARCQVPGTARQALTLGSWRAPAAAASRLSPLRRRRRTHDGLLWLL